MNRLLSFTVLLSISSATWTGVAEDLSPQLKAINALSREGQGNEAAAKAVAALSTASPDQLVKILNAFEDASPLAANYLRNAVESIADRATDSGKKLPKKQIEQFIIDRSNDPRARRLAYEILVDVDSSAEERLIPNMLLDPSPEFRRDAVTRLMDEAKSLEESARTRAADVYRKALTGATDSDLVKSIKKSLEGLGETVSVVAHFGFLTDWKIVGPFNNEDFVGFEAVYQPEEKLDFSSTLKGKSGDVEWQKISTEDEFGIINIAESIAPHKGAVMYLATSFDSAEGREIEFRFGTPNAWKLWLNGEYLFGRDEYHRGMAIDQYRVPAKLKAGKNVILLKLCQNEQTDDWAQRYQIQIRICDPSGVAVLPASTETASINSLPVRKVASNPAGDIK